MVNVGIFYDHLEFFYHEKSGNPDSNPCVSNQRLVGGPHQDHSMHGRCFTRNLETAFHPDE
jgi:hypothetical protein